GETGVVVKLSYPFGWVASHRRSGSRWEGEDSRRQKMFTHRVDAAVCCPRDRPWQYRQSAHQRYRRILLISPERCRGDDRTVLSCVHNTVAVWREIGWSRTSRYR
ncbi:unnamed protein product, partial [Ectocarpus sp. 8 AP-2014]